MQPVSAADLMTAGRFHDAVAALRKTMLSPGAVSHSDILLYAQALIATSAYDEAFNVLNLAMVNRVAKSRALGLQAEIRWIQHRLEEAYNLCLASLEYNLLNSRVQTVRNRCRQALDGETRVTVPAVENGRRFAHAAFYMGRGGNFGDVALPPTIRSTVAHWKPVSEWNAVHVHQQFNKDQVAKLNALDGLVIGGGGLFLPDTSPNGDSGWQWNISLENMQKIDVPIYVIAVGYNLFEGQSFFGDTFKRSLNSLVEKATVIGLRNSGSIAKVRSLLPDTLHEKIRYMPCPTTILSRLIPGDLQDIDIPSTQSRVFLNAAFDRSERRFGETYPDFLDQMAKYVSSLQSDGISVEIAAHLPRDEKLGSDLYEHYGIEMPVHGFYDMDCAEGYNLYREAGLVVGMRGHASMIPFGLGVPILSIVSHPKMQYFLDDIGRPEWGISSKSDTMFSDLYRATVNMLENNSKVREDMDGIQDSLYRDCNAIIGDIQ